MSQRFSPDFKIAAHPQLADYMAGKQVFPILVEVSLTGKCSANCPWCFYRDYKDRMELGINIIARAMEDLKAVGTKAINWTGGGEPTLHSQFPGIAKRCSQIGLKQGLFTNALVEIKYDPSLFEWIRVSKTNMPWNVANIKKLRERCKTVGMCINYSGNDEEVKDALVIAHDIGVDYVQTRPALNLYGSKTTIVPPKIEDPILVNTEYKFLEAGKERGYSLCEGYHFVPFIWHDGCVVACGYRSMDGRFLLGNLKDGSIVSILANAPKSLPVVKECQICCKNHEINRLIDKLHDLKDIDFI